MNTLLLARNGTQTAVLMRSIILFDARSIWLISRLRENLSIKLAAMAVLRNQRSIAVRIYFNGFPELLLTGLLQRSLRPCLITALRLLPANRYLSHNLSTRCSKIRSLSFLSLLMSLSQRRSQGYQIQSLSSIHNLAIPTKDGD